MSKRHKVEKAGRTFRAGQVVFCKGFGSYAPRYGRIARLWGKIPYAATFVDESGPIRVGLDELRVLTKQEKG